MDVHTILLRETQWDSLPLLCCSMISSICAIDAVERGSEMISGTYLAIICSIFSIISSVSGIITVISGSDTMHYLHLLLYVLIWVMLLALSLRLTTPQIPFEPNSNSKTGPIESSSNHVKAQNACTIIINTLFFSLDLLVSLCATLFVSVFISSRKEWMILLTIFDVSKCIICFIMPSVSVNFAMRALQIPPTAVQSPLVQSPRMELAQAAVQSQESAFHSKASDAAND